MKLSVVIPVFNEEKTIERVVDEVLAEQTPKEIIIIDDGSTDGTWKKLQSFKAAKFQRTIRLLRNEKNMGKGAAVIKGIENATGDVLIIQDADLEYSPSDYRKLLAPILKGETEVVYGSRLKNLRLRLFGRGRTPLPLHYLMNRFLSFLTNLLYGSNLTDMETGYKMMSKKVFESLYLTSNRFDIEPEITSKILLNGFHILEVPIVTKPRSYKQGKKIKAKDAVMAIYALFKYLK